MLIVNPVIVRPWMAEWEAAKAEISAVLAKAQEAKSASARTKARDQAVALYRAFLDRLRAFRVLDPACVQASDRRGRPRARARGRPVPHQRPPQAQHGAGKDSRPGSSP
jgi:hypothetical protein